MSLCVCVCVNVFVELSKMAPKRIQITPPPVREKSCVCVAVREDGPQSGCALISNEYKNLSTRRLLPNYTSKALAWNTVYRLGGRYRGACDGTE